MVRPVLLGSETQEPGPQRTRFQRLPRPELVLLELLQEPKELLTRQGRLELPVLLERLHRA